VTGDRSPARTAEHQPHRYRSGLLNKVRGWGVAVGDVERLERGYERRPGKRARSAASTVVGRRRGSTNSCQRRSRAYICLRRRTRIGFSRADPRSARNSSFRHEEPTSLGPGPRLVEIAKQIPAATKSKTVPTGKLGISLFRRASRQVYGPGQDAFHSHEQWRVTRLVDSMICRDRQRRGESAPV
jgi:hypothetical protein